jgi:tetratricopeptide (TPR) repeat protein
MASSSALVFHASRQSMLFLFRAALWTVCLVGLPHLAAAQSDRVGQLSVRVRDRLTENQLEQVRVELIRFPEGIVAEQFTGSDGAVRFTGIGIGAYTVRAMRHGYETGEARVDFRKGDSTVQNVDIPLTPLDRGRPETLGGTVSTQGLQIPESARKELERGRLLLNEKKNPRDSIVAFRRAIAIFPSYADAYFLLGTALMQINQATDAEASLLQAIAIDAHRTAPYYPLAMLLFSQRRFDDERQLLLAAKSMEPTDWRWPFELARCDAQQEHWEPALEYALDASKNSNAPTRVHLLLADIYANSNRPHDAVAELELFARLDPRSEYMERVNEVLAVLRQRATSSAPSPH